MKLKNGMDDIVEAVQSSKTMYSASCRLNADKVVELNHILYDIQVSLDKKIGWDKAYQILKDSLKEV